MNRKILVLIAALVLMGSSGAYVWYEYYRHWNIEDLEDAVITWQYDDMNSMGIDVGFETHLEGRTVTVEGKVDEIRTHETCLGQLNFIYLEGSTAVNLLEWGALDFEEGDDIEMRVEFERGMVNGAEHVFSPQVAFPGFGVFAAYQEIMQTVDWVNGGWVLSLDDDGHDVVLTVEKSPDPVPLEMARCSIRQGMATGAIEYVDTLGFYSDLPDLDTIDGLDTQSGRNDTIEFSDENDDGFLDDGDTIVIHGLIRPEGECSGQTYLVRMDRDLYADEPEVDMVPNVFSAYLIMTEKGLLWINSSETPRATSVVSCTEESLAMTIDYVSRPVSWGDVEFVVSDSEHWERISPDADALSEGAGSSCSCGTIGIGDLLLECMVEDVAGDGFVGVWDSVELRAVNGTTFEDWDVTVLSLEFIPTGIVMLRCESVFGATPTCDCSVSLDTDSVGLTLMPVHNGTDYAYTLMDIAWGDLTVAIDDGVNRTEWSPTDASLDDCHPDTWTAGEQSLGALTVLCAVTDLQGNGLANTGDRIEISVTDGDGFDPACSYTVSVHYTVTDTDLFVMTFDG